MVAVQVGVDVGGTFTDVVAFDRETGELTVAKAPSVPRDQSRGVLAGLEAAGVETSRVERFVHGTTVATNAVLERNGARTVLVVTKGFRDLLEIGRQNRPKLYDLFADRPPPLVPRVLVVEVPERVAVDGTVVTALDADAAAGVARAVRDLAPEAIAVCLLYSFLLPDHERALADAIGRALDGGASVSLSSDVLPVFREYERASTTTLNAYVGPGMARYLGRLESRLKDAELRAQVEVMRSAGGTFTAPMAARLPVHTLLSGPAAGAWGAAAVATRAGFDRVIGFDMGGTSTDVCLIEDGTPRRTDDGSIDGLPFGVATTDIHSIGSGGGSIAWRDEGGALRVGPRSAGAEPGPACYGKGGTEPALTDAFMVLGMLDPDTALGGSIRLRPDLAERAVGGLARELGLDVLACATGILRVTEAQVTKALRVVSVERGKDPRDHALIPFGGAGALLQGRLATTLGVRAVVVPRTPGVLSAIGLLSAPVAVDLARTSVADLDQADTAELEAGWAELEREAAALLADQGFAPSGGARTAACRYRGQAFELDVPAPSPEPRAIAGAFHAAHRERYGYEQPDQTVDVVTLRVRMEGPPASFAPPEIPQGSGADAARTGSRSIWLEDREVECPVYPRDALGAGDIIEGPALLPGRDATCLVMPGQRGRVDEVGALVLARA
jgi:N-methylhydantoinase A